MEKQLLKIALKIANYYLIENGKRIEQEAKRIGDIFRNDDNNDLTISDIKKLEENMCKLSEDINKLKDDSHIINSIEAELQRVSSQN